MASYIIKSKKLNIDEKQNKKLSIGRFYSGDRFYTILNEYIDINLRKRNIFMAWIIDVLFKSSNFKHDPGIANGQPWSVKLFDWFCISCIIIFIALTGTTILIPVISAVLNPKDFVSVFEQIKQTTLSIGITAIIFCLPSILWLWIYFAIRRKNKPLTLQAFVEKKISYCLILRFLIKNIKVQPLNVEKEVILMENFEAQGAQAPRWLNIKLINLICSIFPEFNYIFKFDNLTEEEVEELQPIITHDFMNIELINSDNIAFHEWEKKPVKKLINLNLKKKQKNKNN